MNITSDGVVRRFCTSGLRFTIVAGMLLLSSNVLAQSPIAVARSPVQLEAARVPLPVQNFDRVSPVAPPTTTPTVARSVQSPLTPVDPKRLEISRRDLSPREGGQNTAVGKSEP